MNYRHDFHAGNFADVVKHAALARILVHLCAKPTPFRVIDTHAGAGLYNLAGPEANRTGEWRDGIGRLLSADLAPHIGELLRPYVDAITRHNGGGPLRTYAGSPLIARALLRPQDRLTACEIEPTAVRALSRQLRGDPRAKVVDIDGWIALEAYVPPKQRRGLVLVDPAFEAPNEFARLADGLAAAHRKWSSGIYMLWYPIKGRREPDALARRLLRHGIAKMLRAELTVAPPRDPERLNGCGLVIVNPPWKLERDLLAILPALAAVLAREPNGRARIDRLSGES